MQKKKFLTVKKLLSLLLIMCILAIFFQNTGYANVKSVTCMYTSDLDLNKDDVIDYTTRFYCENPTLKTKFVSSSEKTYKYMRTFKNKYNIYSKNINVGAVHITVNKFPNEDVMFFVDYSSTLNGINLYYEIIACGMNENYTAHIAKRTPDFSINKGKNLKKIPNNVTYIDFPNRYMKFNKTVSAKYMGHSVYDISEPSSQCTVYKTGKDMCFKLVLPSSKGKIVRSSWILSSKPLVNWKNDLAYRSVLNMDIKNNVFYFCDGVYRVNAPNYLPRSKPSKSYFKDPCGFHVRACKWVLDQGSLFNDMGIYTMYSFANSYINKGYIPTQPKSQWLYKDFGIGHNFYDTRFNSDTASSLIAFYYNYPDEFVLSKIKNYMEFYKKFYNDKKFKADNAVFAPDYMDYSGKNKTTHCSLNHLIAEAQTLYEYYELVRDESSLEIARNIVKSINQTSNKWIRSNGDLWYKVSPDGKYSTNDYPTLTYTDLINLSSVIKRVEKKVPVEISKLLESKKKWANSKGYIH